MPVEQNLNKILKEMWRIDEVLISGKSITDTEKEFFNNNLPTIKNYYESNNKYWGSREILD